jgi:hypothetical protein
VSDNGSVKTVKMRKTGSNRTRVNSAKATSSFSKRRLRSNLVDLTPAEQRLLNDPDWIDENESDLLLALRREAEEGNKAIPFEQVVKELGYKVDDFLPARRKARASVRKG